MVGKKLRESVPRSVFLLVAACGYGRIVLVGKAVVLLLQVLRLLAHRVAVGLHGGEGGARLRQVVAQFLHRVRLALLLQVLMKVKLALLSKSGRARTFWRAECAASEALFACFIAASAVAPSCASCCISCIMRRMTLQT